MPLRSTYKTLDEYDKITTYMSGTAPWANGPRSELDTPPIEPSMSGVLGEEGFSFGGEWTAKNPSNYQTLKTYSDQERLDGITPGTVYATPAGGATGYGEEYRG